MPPKTSSGASKKTEKKIQEKIIEDKTFGLKNKNKSKTVQKFCKGVATQVKTGNVSIQKEINAEFEAKKAQKKLEEEKALLASLYKTVETAKSKQDEEKDPKMTLCAYFKQGLCQKGKKCKYSHDLDIETKTEEIDIYTDQRMQLFDQNVEEDMEKWDEKKLVEVVKAQEGKYKNQKPTEIICKFFLDAVENRKYGWKWVCPNGMGCIYRHCLPPNYVLKRDMVLGKKEDDTILEEVLEEERSKITSANGTPVTRERFYAWKDEKKKKKEEEIEKKRKEEAKKTGTKGTNVLSGRALFKYDPSLFQVDDDGAADLDEYENRSEDEEEKGEGQLDDVAEGENEDDEGENQEEENEEEEEKYEEEKNEDIPKEVVNDRPKEMANNLKENGNGEQNKEEMTENWEELNEKKEDGEGKKKKKKKNKKEKEVIKDEKNDVNIDKDVFLQDEDI